MRQIDYLHEYEGTLYQGKFTSSPVDGRSVVTWVYLKGDSEVKQQEAVDGERFESLWRFIGESAIFRRAPVRRDFHGANPLRYHLIGTSSDQSDERDPHVFLVSAEESDVEFVRWLAELNGPWN